VWFFRDYAQCFAGSNEASFLAARSLGGPSASFRTTGFFRSGQAGWVCSGRHDYQDGCGAPKMDWLMKSHGWVTTLGFKSKIW
jgi:hypothetical protein